MSLKEYVFLLSKEYVTNTLHVPLLLCLKDLCVTLP